jgi:hypothetical protein
VRLARADSNDVPVVAVGVGVEVTTVVETGAFVETGALVETGAFVESGGDVESGEFDGSWVEVTTVVETGALVETGAFDESGGDVESGEFDGSRVEEVMTCGMASLRLLTSGPALLLRAVRMSVPTRIQTTTGSRSHFFAHHLGTCDPSAIEATLVGGLKDQLNDHLTDTAEGSIQMQLVWDYDESITGRHTMDG